MVNKTFSSASDTKLEHMLEWVKKNKTMLQSVFDTFHINKSVERDLIGQRRDGLNHSKDNLTNLAADERARMGKDAKDRGYNLAANQLMKDSLGLDKDLYWAVDEDEKQVWTRVVENPEEILSKLGKPRSTTTEGRWDVYDYSNGVQVRVSHQASKEDGDKRGILFILPMNTLKTESQKSFSKISEIFIACEDTLLDSTIADLGRNLSKFAKKYDMDFREAQNIASGIIANLDLDCEWGKLCKGQMTENKRQALLEEIRDARQSKI